MASVKTEWRKSQRLVNWHVGTNQLPRPPYPIGWYLDQRKLPEAAAELISSIESGAEELHEMYNEKLEVVGPRAGGSAVRSYRKTIESVDGPIDVVPEGILFEAVQESHAEFLAPLRANNKEANEEYWLLLSWFLLYSWFKHLFETVAVAMTPDGMVVNIHRPASWAMNYADASMDILTNDEAVVMAQIKAGMLAIERAHIWRPPPFDFGPDGTLVAVRGTETPNYYFKRHR